MAVGLRRQLPWSTQGPVAALMASNDTPSCPSQHCLHGLNSKALSYDQMTQCCSHGSLDTFTKWHRGQKEQEDTTPVWVHPGDEGVGVGSSLPCGMLRSTTVMHFICGARESFREDAAFTDIQVQGSLSESCPSVSSRPEPIGRFPNCSQPSVPSYGPQAHCAPRPACWRNTGDRVFRGFCLSLRPAEAAGQGVGAAPRSLGQAGAARASAPPCGLSGTGLVRHSCSGGVFWDCKDVILSDVTF